MLSHLFQIVARNWQRLSKSEQRLAAAVGAMLVLWVVFMTLQRSLAAVDRLDRRIDRMQQDLVNYNFQMAVRQSVETEFAKVAAQHSSQWTEAEIYDRLKLEIYRLAEKEPPPLDEQGVPVKSTSDKGRLVNIPGLGKGTLHDSGEGYREYRITFSVPPVDLESLTAFLTRLLESPQSLRIDGLEMTRGELDTQAGATIHLTRIVANQSLEVLASPDSKAEAMAATEPVQGDLDVRHWRSAGCHLDVSADYGLGGSEALLAKATGREAHLRMMRSLDPGETYDLYLDCRVTGPGRLAVSDEDGKNLLESPEPLRDDGQPYRYHIRFTVPEGRGKIEHGVPCLLLDEAGAVAFVDKLVLKKTSG